MEEGIVKIGDYGLAKLITPSHGTEHSESIGTCHYMAPEIGSGKYNKPIDVYSIGVILYEMLTGKVPFDGETVNEVLMKHLTARPDVSMLAEPYRSIVAKALAKDPNHRPSRLYDLLPPEDAPRAARRADHRRRQAAGRGPVQDDVLRIEAEEPVFYIGPDTRPPRTPQCRWNPPANPGESGCTSAPGAVPVRNRPAPSPGRHRAPVVVRKANYARSGPPRAATAAASAPLRSLLRNLAAACAWPS